MVPVPVPVPVLVTVPAPVKKKLVATPVTQMVEKKPTKRKVPPVEHTTDLAATNNDEDEPVHERKRKKTKRSVQESLAAVGWKPRSTVPAEKIHAPATATATDDVHPLAAVVATFRELKKNLIKN